MVGLEGLEYVIPKYKHLGQRSPVSAQSSQIISPQFSHSNVAPLGCLHLLLIVFESSVSVIIFPEASSYSTSIACLLE
jgi:hypothetical protein